VQEVYPPKTHFSIDLVSLATECNLYVLLVGLACEQPTDLLSDHVHVQVATATSAITHANVFQLSFDVAVNGIGHVLLDGFVLEVDQFFGFVSCLNNQLDFTLASHV